MNRRSVEDVTDTNPLISAIEEIKRNHAIDSLSEGETLPEQKTKIVDISSKSVTAQLVGTPDKIQSFIDIMSQYGIREISRTGVTAVSRG